MEGERRPEPPPGRDPPQPALHARTWGSGDGIGAAERHRRVLPSERTFEVDQRSGGQVVAQGTGRFFLDERPRLRADGRLVAAQAAAHSSCFPSRSPPIERLPWPLPPPPELSPPPSPVTSCSRATMDPSEKRYWRSAASRAGSWRRSHSSVMTACSFSSS